MTRRKFTAMLTALACAVSAMPMFTAFSLSSGEMTEYMVVKVSTNADGDVTGLILSECNGTCLSQVTTCGADIAAMLEGEETPEWGDIIRLSAPDAGAEIIPLCMHYGAVPEYENLGNVTEIGTLEYLTVEGYDQTSYGQITRCQLVDGSSNSYFYYPDEDYGIPAPDVTKSTGDLYYLYNGTAVLLADMNETNWEQATRTTSGILIGPGLLKLNLGTYYEHCHFDDTIDDNGRLLNPGDVVEIKYSGEIAESYPAYIIGIESVRRMGTAAELYGYGEYTVTEQTEHYLSITNETEETTKFYYLDDSYSYYNNELLTNAQPGNVLAFMHDKFGRPVLPVEPDDLLSRIEFAVIGVDDAENPQNYIIIESRCPTAVFCMGASDLADYLANGGEPLSYGDIFSIAGTYACTCIWGTNDIMFEKPETIRIEGSVFDKAETAEFTTASSPYDSSFIWLEGAENKYEYPVDFMIDTGLSFGDSDFTQPDGIDWTKPDLGDKITMYVYNGVPMFPKAMERIGDADGNQEINASDAAQMLIIAAENGAGARNAVTFSNDVNQDGVTDAMDAAAVLVYAAARGSGVSLSWSEVNGAA